MEASVAVLSLLEVPALLMSWGFDDLVDEFIEKGIDYDALKVITFEDLNILVPDNKLGVRIKLRQKILEWRYINGIGVPLAETLNVSNRNVQSWITTSGAELSGISTASSKKFTLEQLLCNGIVGKELLRLHETKQSLTNVNRNSLVTIICDYWLNGGHQPQSNDYVEAANQIIRLFPQESEDTYLGTKTTRGKLVQKFYSLTQKFKSSGVIKRRSNLKKQADSCQDSYSFEADDTVFETDVINDVNWLKRNKDPAELVFQKWNSTYEFRKTQMKKSAADIFTEWPILKQIIGSQLIELDFNKNFPGRSEIFFSKWEIFSTKIRVVYQREIKDAANKSLFAKLKSDVSEDAENHILVTLLNAVLIPQINRQGSKKSGKLWKPSILDAQHAFACHVEDLKNIPSLIDKRKEKYDDYNCCIQPFIILVGKSILSFTEKEGNYIIMLACFLCIHNFADVGVYIKHLKHHHKLISTSNFQCTNCPQMFQSLYSFKRHLSRTHISDLISSSECNKEINSINLPQLTKVTPDTTNPVNHSSFKELSTSDENNEKPLKTDSKLPQIQLEAAKFAIKYYGKLDLSRKTANEMVCDIQGYILRPLIDFLEHEFSTYLEANQVDKFKNVLNDIYKIFDNVNTEYKFKKYLKEVHNFSGPQEFSIDNSLTIYNASNNTKKGVLLPIKENIKHFFELHNIFPSIINNMKNLEYSSRISNIVQGEIWQRKIKDLGNKIVVPYILYQDDFEVNNPLGSKRGVHKMSAFYIMFPMLHFNEFSKLENIFPCCLSKTRDMNLGLQHNLNFLISELKYLEEKGVDININGEIKKVHLILAALTGDNLGINTITGFTKCFQANYFCRICKAHKTQMSSQCVEEPKLLRNVENYAADLKQNDLSSTGIKEICPFNNIKTFHVVENFVVDIMHDIFEGICHEEIALILDYFICNKSYFSLNELNCKKKYLVHDEIDNRNLCEDISQDNIKNRSFKMSASEMQSFIHYLPLYIGEFVPKNDIIWKFFQLFLRLIDLCIRPSFDEEGISNLREVIMKHHQKYQKLFNRKLLPKHHFMVHYPTVVKKMGRLRNLWSMRFEAKHKELKKYAASITSRKNISLSIATKLQYSVASNFLHRRSTNDIIEMGPISTINLSLIPEILSCIQEKHLPEIICSEEIYIFNTLYKNKNIIVITKSGLFSFYSFFCAIKNPHNVNEFSVIAQKILIEKYDSHFDYYIVKDILPNEYTLISTVDITHPPINIVSMYGQFNVIKPRTPFS